MLHDVIVPAEYVTREETGNLEADFICDGCFSSIETEDWMESRDEQYKYKPEITIDCCGNCPFMKELGNDSCICLLESRGIWDVDFIPSWCKLPNQGD